MCKFELFLIAPVKNREVVERVELHPRTIIGCTLYHANIGLFIAHVALVSLLLTIVSGVLKNF